MFLVKIGRSARLATALRPLPTPSARARGKNVLFRDKFTVIGDDSINDDKTWLK